MKTSSIFNILTKTSAFIETGNWFLETCEEQISTPANALALLQKKDKGGKKGRQVIPNRKVMDKFVETLSADLKKIFFLDDNGKPCFVQDRSIFFYPLLANETAQVPDEFKKNENSKDLFKNSSITLTVATNSPDSPPSLRVFFRGLVTLKNPDTFFSALGNVIQKKFENSIWMVEFSKDFCL